MTPNAQPKPKPKPPHGVPPPFLSSHLPLVTFAARPNSPRSRDPIFPPTRPKPNPIGSITTRTRRDPLESSAAPRPWPPTPQQPPPPQTTRRACWYSKTKKISPPPSPTRPPNLSGKFATERGAFSVVISGGSLVKAVRKLVAAPYADSIEWGKWHVLWVDERVVPKDHEDSNYKLAYDGFLCKVPIPPGHVYAIYDSLPAEGAADDCGTCLRQLVKNGVLQSAPTGFPNFDLMLLGMGPDGHVASLFLDERERRITFIKDSPKPPPERITFTFPVINSSANIALVATGSGKAGVVQQALGGGNSSSVMLPVQRITLEDGELTWFVDKAAASKLQDKSTL